MKRNKIVEVAKDEIVSELEKTLKEGKVLHYIGNDIKVKVLFKKIMRLETVFNIYVDEKIHHSGKQFNTMDRKLKRLIQRNNLVKIN